MKTSGNLSADPLKEPYGFLPWNLSRFLRYLFRMFFRRNRFFFHNCFCRSFFLLNFYALSLFRLHYSCFAFLLFFFRPVPSAESMQRNPQHSDRALCLSVLIAALQNKQPEQPGNFPAGCKFFQTIFLFMDLSVIADRNKQKRTKDQKQQEKENQQYNSYYFQYQQQNMYHL